MKAMILYSYPVLLASVLLLGSCKKPARDNPEDKKNPANAAAAATATVTTEKAEVKFSNYEVYTDDNSNGQVDRGETVQLKVYLTNNGKVRANKVKAYIYCNNSGNNLAVLEDTRGGYYYYGITSNDYIDPGQKGFPQSGDYLQFGVSSTAATGSYTFNVSISDEAGENWADHFIVIIH